MSEPTKLEYGPYKVNVEWSALVSEEEMDKAVEIISTIAKDVDRSADFELNCVQSITFTRE